MHQQNQKYNEKIKSIFIKVLKNGLLFLIVNEKRVVLIETKKAASKTNTIFINCEINASDQYLRANNASV